MTPRPDLRAAARACILDREHERMTFRDMARDALEQQRAREDWQRHRDRLGMPSNTAPVPPAVPQDARKPPPEPSGCARAVYEALREAWGEVAHRVRGWGR